jgi:hypothetical protein
MDFSFTRNDGGFPCELSPKQELYMIGAHDFFVK